MKTQLFDTNLTLKLVEGAFGGAYSRYRIDGVEGMDLPTFFSKTRDSMLSILRRESARRAMRSQTTTWIKFMKGSEYVHVVMPWQMVTKCGVNVTLKEAVEEIKKDGEERRLVSKFEAEHRDEIDEILGVIDYIDKGYVKDRFPEIYKFGCERLGIHFKDKFVHKEYGPWVTP